MSQFEIAATLPPRRPDVAPTWRCRLFGCHCDAVQVDAWWKAAICRWCGRRDRVWLEPEVHCTRCGQATGAPPPPPLNTKIRKGG